MSARFNQCIVCGDENFTNLYRPKRSPGEVVRCQGCGFVAVRYIDDGRSIINEQTAARVEERLLSSRDLGDLVGCWEVSELTSKLAEIEALRANAIDALDRIERYSTPPGRLLDFGCGWGFFLDVARERGWLPYGLEPLPGHALYVRAKVEADVVTDILRDSTYPADYFDAITSFQVFEHLPDPAGDLVRLQQALRPGGILLIEVPNIKTWGVRLMGKRHRHFVPDHLNFFSDETLGRLFQASGLEILETYHPTRQMSFRHLITAWGGRLLPEVFTSTSTRLFQNTKIWNKTFGLNIGDIVAVIGRKPLS